MRTGLVLGKFMPFHKGHISLINFALSRCDRLLVAVCSLPTEPIDGNIRYQWVADYFIDESRCCVLHITENLPGGSDSDREVSRVWAFYLKQSLPRIDVIFASEQYAEYVAEYMDIDYEIYDIPRNNVPVSATMIRSNPLKYWDFMPELVRPYFVKTICLYGGESCGKTTLTKRLAEYFHTTYVPEMARYVQEFSSRSWDSLTPSMFTAFARAQRDMIETMKPTANKLLFIDTDYVTTQIYANSYINMSPLLIEKYATKRFDLYFLLHPDIPFIQDGTRRYPHERDKYHILLEQHLQTANKPYITLSGDYETRFNKACSAIQNMFNP